MKNKKENKETSFINRKFFYSLSLILFIIFITITFIFLKGAVNIINKDQEKFLIDISQDSIDDRLPVDIFFQENKNKHVIRIKAYDKNGIIIYSDKKELIGKIFFSNEKLKKALKGLVVAETDNTHESENLYEKFYKHLVEVYIPYYKNGELQGVIEFYYKISVFSNEIINFERIILIIISLIFLSLFLILSFSFKKSSEKIKKINRRKINTLKKISKLKDDFVFIASHELRAPINIIRGYIEMISDEKRIKNVDLKKYLSKIDNASQELLVLINDLLEIARGEARKTKIKLFPLNINNIIEETILKFDSLRKKNKITITYNKKKIPQVLANEDKLKEILNNLISNAIKYNKLNGKIIVTHEVRGKKLITHIQDTGLGIKKESLKNVFKKFNRFHTKVVNIPGTGLGLFIVKELLDRMNGRVSVKSTYGDGSTFSFELPIVR